MKIPKFALFIDRLRPLPEFALFIDRLRPLPGPWDAQGYESER